MESLRAVFACIFGHELYALMALVVCLALKFGRPPNTLRQTFRSTCLSSVKAEDYDVRTQATSEVRPHLG